MKPEEIFKALADSNRLRIMNLLLRRELCVCEIEETLGLSQTNVSRHLNKLSQAGLLESRKEAQWIYYRADQNFLTGHVLLVKYLTNIFENDEGYIKELNNLNEAQKNTGSIRSHQCKRKQ